MEIQSWVSVQVWSLELVSFQMEQFLWRIGTGMNFRISELSNGNISLEDWYWYELWASEPSDGNVVLKIIGIGSLWTLASFQIYH